VRIAALPAGRCRGFWQPRAARALAVLLALSGIGCDTLPGRPRPEDRPVAPAEVLDFDTLYASNCAGCHGADGRLGAARALNDPLYLGLVNEAIVRKIISDGIPGTSQPAFAQSAGGMLTDAQTDVIARGVFSHWAQPDRVRGVQMPPYAQTGGGDAARGADAYGRYCARCHGVQGTGGPQSGSIVDPSYLALVTDQALRTAVIAGRPDLGMPDWRAYVPGQPMSAQEITDVVAWLAAQRVKFPGQPYPQQAPAAQ
jgi:cytochrome c oxidase cbb3-type subunit 3